MNAATPYFILMVVIGLALVVWTNDSWSPWCWATMLTLGLLSAAIGGVLGLASILSPDHARQVRCAEVRVVTEYWGDPSGGDQELEERTTRRCLRWDPERERP